MPRLWPTRPSRALAAALTAGALAASAACAGGGDDQRPRSAATTTTRAPRDHALVVAAGDIACQPGRRASEEECQHAAVAELIAFLDPDYVFALGDLQYPHGEREHFPVSYGATWGRFDDITRPVPGNHEYETDGDGYYAYWGDAAHPPNGWYSFDIAEHGWHVVALNSNCGKVGCAVGSEQEQWLRADLEASNAQCTLMMFHHPNRASGRHGGTGSVKPFVDALEDDRGELVLAAHDHLYERFAPEEGVRHFVAGTGGRSHYDVGEREPGSEVVDTTNFGVLELKLRSGSYAWRFVALGNRVIDEGQESCR